MPKTSGTIPNLINGISQQSPTMRLPSQAEASTNYYPTITDGLVKRPRTDHLAVLDALPAGTFTHFILRDEVEEYVVAIQADGTIRVWDFHGDEKTVSNEGGAYLSGLTDASKEVEALTLIDHTFITNKTKTVAAGSTTSPTRPYEALINVAAGNYGRTYRVFINDDEAAFITTPNGGDESDSPYIDTTLIADRLYVGLAFGASGTGDRGYAYDGDGGFNTPPWALGRYNSTLYLRNDTTDFTIATEDGYNGRAMKDIKRVVQNFSDLPLYGPNGVVVEVTGTASNSFDNYWVEFQKDDDENSTGVWKECPAPGTRLGLDAGTMPHVLVREEDGTFTFRAAEWEDRKCGDLESVPDPSFVGQRIIEIFFHKNRLGFLTGENIVMSASGQFYNFYRSTLTALLDTDPIDVAASHTKISILHHAVLFQKELLAFSENTQFVVSGNELLTPKTVNGDPLTELSASPDVRPQAAATSIYFMSEGDRWASLYEYYIDKSLEAADYDDVSGHAPIFVPAGVHNLAVSPDLDLALIATDGDPNAIYVYKFFWSGDEKLQSAWCRWSYPNADRIVNITFKRRNVLLLVERDGMLHLETFTAEPSAKDPDLPFVIYLDQSVVLDNGVYDPSTDTTTFTLPYAAPADIKAVTVPGGATLPGGVELTVSGIDGTTVEIAGEVGEEIVRFGVQYDSRHRLSTLYERGRDGQQVDEDGRLQVMSLSLVYANSAYFRVEVTPQGRRKRTYTFTGRVIADSDNKTGEVVLDDGRFALPIMSRNDRVIIELVNDTWRPSAFISAKWRGHWNPYSRQL